jgi:hypothetical protein
MRPNRHTLPGVRNDLLYRLCWDILTDLETIKITTGHNDQITNVLLFGHPLANESIANPPISRVDKLCIGECLEKYSFDYAPEEYRYRPPAAGTIINDDGSPITRGQFVTETYAYFKEHMEEVKKVKGELHGKDELKEDSTVRRVITYGQPYLPPDIVIYFHRIDAVCIDNSVSQILQISVTSLAEGELGFTSDKFWAMQRKLGGVQTDSR